MLANTKIGIIGGTGWMGKAMGEALLSRLIAPEQLWVCNASGKNNYVESINFTTDPQILIDQCDIVILSVLPKQFPQLKIDAKNKLVISIMAMVATQNIEQHVHAKRIIRAMPNAAIPEFESYTPWYANPTTTFEDKQIAQTIFNCFGTSDEVPSEDQLNFLTALTGSSHGWLAFFAEVLIEIGVMHDLSPEFSERAIRQVMKGVGKLIANECPSPQETVKILTDYAGTTAAGLVSFANSDMADLIAEGIKASYEKAKGS